MVPFFAEIGARKTDKSCEVGVFKINLLHEDSIVKAYVPHNFGVSDNYLRFYHVYLHIYLYYFR